MDGRSEVDALGSGRFIPVFETRAERKKLYDAISTLRVS